MLQRVALLAVAFLSIPAHAGRDSITPTAKTEVVQGLVKTIETNAYLPGVDFAKLEGYLSAEKDSIDKASDEDAFRVAVTKALDKFGFSHMSLFTPLMVAQRRDSATVGIGIMAQYLDHKLIVHRVYHDSPAFEAGLLAGDEIVEVNGKAPEVPSALAGSEGEVVTIRFVHPDSGQTIRKTITRRRFSTIVPPSLRWIGADTAVLSVPTFDLSYDRDEVDDLMKDAQRAKSLVLDLRSNGGGTVVSMCHLLGYFIASDRPVGTFVTKTLAKQYEAETKGDPSDVAKVAAWSKRSLKPAKAPIPVFAGHLAVLVNGTSGSASEIAAEALKENRDAEIVGERSAGKCLVSVVAQLPHGFQIQYPIYDFVSPKGLRLEGAGVTPDLAVKDPKVLREGQPDAPLDSAVALLRRAQLRDDRFGAASN